MIEITHREEKKIMITQAQRTAVEALDLPFALSDTDIERQFEADGTAKPREQRDPEPLPAKDGSQREYKLAD